jgi:hypothetical protein
MTHKGLPSLAIDPYAKPARQLLGAGNAKVVARVGIFRVRIAQADDEPRLGYRASFN